MDNLLNPANAHQQRCPRCQSPLNTVVVHGHEQCVICKSNIFECCSGDTTKLERAEVAPASIARVVGHEIGSQYSLALSVYSAGLSEEQISAIVNKVSYS